MSKKWYEVADEMEQAEKKEKKASTPKKNTPPKKATKVRSTKGTPKQIRTRKGKVQVEDKRNRTKSPEVSAKPKGAGAPKEVVDEITEKAKRAMYTSVGALITNARGRGMMPQVIQALEHMGIVNEILQEFSPGYTLQPETPTDADQDTPNTSVVLAQKSQSSVVLKKDAQDRIAWEIKAYADDPHTAAAEAVKVFEALQNEVEYEDDDEA